MKLPNLVKDRLIRRDELDTGTKKSNDFRVRKYVKDSLANLDEILWILDTLPENQVSKIFAYEDAYRLFKLTEKVVAALGPSPFAAADENGKHHVHRHFKVDLSNKLSGLTKSTVGIELVYEPTDEEVKFFQELTNHSTELEATYQRNERPSGVFTSEELDKKIASIVKGRPYTANVVSVATDQCQEIA
ncbi:MAG: hypothetical protein ABR985_12095 [Methanotrichaceae archaeon]|jgi:hypothetical protein